MRVSQFFEVQIKPGRVDTYLDMAASLKPLLDKMGGCMSIERFKSHSRSNLLLSYQIWRDEASLTAWRSNAQHHAVQCMGRAEIFSDYRIRVAQVVHEQQPGANPWTPMRLTTYNDPVLRPPTFAVISESRCASAPTRTMAPYDSFESVYRPGQFAHLFDVPSADAGAALGMELLADPTTEYFRVFEVYRDYGMFDRREAPQYYPPPEHA